MTIQDFVLNYTARGECRCGKCIDNMPGATPLGPHTIDMVFFQVAASLDVSEALVEQFKTLSHENKSVYVDVDPFDGKEHSYIELGAWIGDQGLAMQYMALGVALGLFVLMTPYTMLHLPKGDPLAMQMAGAGFVAVQRK